jgi:SanA protein
MRKWLNLLIRVTFLVSITGFTIYFFAIELSDRITFHATQHTSDSLEELPHCKVGIVLGTSKWVETGRINKYFQYRIEAAVKLFESGKVDYILVSGDNGTLAYNEPREFRNMLIEAGIPEDRIYLDFAGFRTFDSMVRAKEVFGQEKFIVISQAFQNERAVFIARSKGIEAYGFNAQNVSVAGGWLTRQREKLARLKVYLDLYILNTKPKYLGEEIQIG